MKKYIYLLLLVFVILLAGCKNNVDSEKQLIGFTLYEKNNPYGISETINSLNDIEINGVYASDDYSYVSIQGESFFDVKTDLSKLQGDLITKDNICLFITSNYYQSQNANHKLFLYEIYKHQDGTYSIEYKTDIQLSSDVGDTEVINFKSESIKDDLNYVFTYRINLEKIATPSDVLIKEFNIDNELIKTTPVTGDINEYQIQKNTKYVLIEEYSIKINEHDEEETIINYTFLTQDSSKKNYTFKMINDNNRIINYQVSFIFYDDIFQ